jgi:hypothetical protein
MPIFYFNLRGEGCEVPDLAGRLCADAEAAKVEAERLAAELVETALVAGARPPEATIEVTDEELRPVLVLPLSNTGGQT